MPKKKTTGAHLMSSVDSTAPPPVFDLQELREHILSFASVKDLCHWDLVSRSFYFEKWTEPFWNQFSMTKFGLQNGKEGWRLGLSLTTREPTLIEMHDDGDFGFGQSYAGSATVACSDSIVVAVHDYNSREHRTFPVDGNSQLGVRDAFSLNYMRTVPSPMISNSNVAICGPPDAEVIVTSGNYSVAAHRGVLFQHLLVTDFDQDFDMLGADPNNTSMLLLGCETHVILVTSSTLYVFQVDYKPLLTYRSKAPIRSCPIDDVISWTRTTTNSNSNEFVFCTTDNHVCIWKLDPVSSTAVHLRDFNPDLADLRTAISTERFIIATCTDKMIHVYELASGEKWHTLDDKVEESGRWYESNHEYPLSLIPFGDLVVSSSREGHFLCVWHLGSGELLQRHEHAEHYSGSLPDGVDVASMVYLERLNAVVTMTWGMYAWTFPFSLESEKMAQSIKRRERQT